MIIKIGKKNLFFLYLALNIMLISPEYFGYIPYFSKFYGYGSVLVCIFLLIFYSLQKNFFKNKILCSLGIFYLCMLISTIINSGTLYIQSQIQEFIKCFGMISMVSYGIKKHKYEFLLSLTIVLSAYTYINFLSVLIFPAGIFKVILSNNAHWFLGHKNLFINVYLLAIIVNIEFDFLRAKKISINLIMLFITSLYSLYRVSALTSIIVVFICGLGYMLYILFENNKIIISIKYAYITAIVLNLALILFESLQLRSSVAIFLGKDISFTGRTIIWENAISWITKSPVIGWGFEYVKDISYKLGGNINFVNCHNFFLDVIYKGGFIAFVVLLIFFISVYREFRVLEERTNISFCFFILIAIFILFLIEACVERHYYFSCIIVLLEYAKIKARQIQEPFYILNTPVGKKRKRGHKRVLSQEMF